MNKIYCALGFGFAYNLECVGRVIVIDNVKTRCAYKLFMSRNSFDYDFRELAIFVLRSNVIKKDCI